GEVSTLGTATWSNLSLRKTHPVPSAAAWSGSAKLAPGRKENSAWKSSRRSADIPCLSILTKCCHVSSEGCKDAANRCVLARQQGAGTSDQRELSTKSNGRRRFRAAGVAPDKCT